MLPERACEAPGCRSDSECERHKRCCYNGCIYACLESVQPPPGGWSQGESVQPPARWVESGGVSAAPRQVGGVRGSQCSPRQVGGVKGVPARWVESGQSPPVLDWLVQPKPRWLGGNGWLLDGPEEALQAEACSTTEDGDEPLHCPTGYNCHIISPGNPAAGVPNRGQCIKQRGNSGKPRLQTLTQGVETLTQATQTPTLTHGV
ncbi:hypothetical protein CRUP_032224 [Coryphaenoides rupestris]|nr:hypothetical protein CRUP_032224 [Coryphaenoides rupestris]